jgi:hypothetical protein
VAPESFSAAEFSAASERLLHRNLQCTVGLTLT